MCLVFSAATCTAACASTGAAACALVGCFVVWVVVCFFFWFFFCCFAVAVHFLFLFIIVVGCNIIVFGLVFFGLFLCFGVSFLYF